MAPDRDGEATREPRRAGEAVINSRIGESIDLLLDYLIDNQVQGIYPLIMGEVERRILRKALDRSQGNKMQAAKLIGISRNTFRRKVQLEGNQ